MPVLTLLEIFTYIASLCSDLYVNHVVQGGTNYPRINFDDYDNIEKINEYLEKVESKANAYLSKVTHIELSRKMKRKMRDGQLYSGNRGGYFDRFLPGRDTLVREERLIALLYMADGCLSSSLRIGSVSE